MKKTLLAAAILSSLVSATSHAATVYDKDGTTMKVGGRVEVRTELLDTGDETISDKSRARINFKGKTEIAEGLTGFAKMEYELKQTTEDGTDFDTRELYAGLGTTFGKFSYGKQDTSNVQLSDMTDIASEHSGQQQYIGVASDKENNTFLYSIDIAEQVTINSSYQFDDGVAADEDADDAFGLSALWSSDFGLDLGAAYTTAEDDSQATLGAAYTLNDLYLAATYAMGDDGVDNEFTSLEAAIQYKFTKEFRLIGIIGMAEDDTADTEDFFAVEGQYRFNKSIRTYASYKLNNLDDGEDELLLGLRYNF